MEKVNVAESLKRGTIVKERVNREAELEWALREMRKAYGALHDGLSDMIEGGRLREGDIPDDYRWLVESLAVPCADADAAAKAVLGGEG